MSGEFPDPLTWLSLAAPCLALVVVLFMAAAIPRPFVAAIGNLRPGRAGHYLAMVILGFYLGGWIPDREATTAILRLVLAGGAVLLAWMAAVGINDLADLEADQIDNPQRPLVRGLITARQQIAVVAGFLLASLLTAAGLGFGVLILLALVHLLQLAYSLPPLRLKRFVGLAHLVIALVSLLVCLIGFLARGLLPLEVFPLRYTLTLLVVFSLGSHFKDLKDLEGDRSQKVATLPVLLGPRQAVKVIAALAAISFLVVPLLLGIPALLPAALCFAAAAVLLLTAPRPLENLFLLSYLIFLLMLIMTGNLSPLAQ